LKSNAFATMFWPFLGSEVLKPAILMCVSVLVSFVHFCPAFAQKQFPYPPSVESQKSSKSTGNLPPPYPAPYSKQIHGKVKNELLEEANSDAASNSGAESLSFLGQVSLGYSLGQLVFPQPGRDSKTPKCDLSAGSKGCRTQQPNTILFSGLAGFRSRNVSQFFFVSYYKYSLFWDVESNKNTNFSDYFQSPKSTTSPLPTRGLLRVHEWNSDVRYLHERFRIGAQFQLALGRQNSAIFAQEGEEARNYFSSELFLPYLILMYENIWRTRIYFPFYTIVNYDDPSYTSTTMSLSQKGRGYVASAGINNSFFFPAIWLTSGLDFSYIDSKYKAVSNDRSRYGAATRFNYTPPIFYGAWIEPRFSFYRERFYVPTAMIPGYEDDDQTTNGAIAINRQDDIYKFTGKLGYDFWGSHRIEFEYSLERRNSNIYTYSSQKMNIILNYRWVFPALNQVIRYVKNTDRDPSNGVFEGEGG
jgi:hypothetical protein